MKKHKKEIINFTIFILGIILIALTFNVFCVSNNYITGGLSGVSIVFKYLFDINVSTTLLIGNIFLIILGTLVLGTKKIIPSIVGSVLYTFVVYLTENILMENIKYMEYI